MNSFAYEAAASSLLNADPEFILALD